MVEIAVNPLPNSPLTGTSGTGAGVTGSSNTGPGLAGFSIGPPAGPRVLTPNPPPPLPPGDGVQGTGENGVHGISHSTAGSGVLGENSATGTGVKGTSAHGDGVIGASISADGVSGQSQSGFGVHGQNFYLVIGGGTPAPPPAMPVAPPASAAPRVKAMDCGVFGESVAYEGVFGVSDFQHGMHGVAGQLSGFTPARVAGMWGESSAGFGVCATSTASNGLWASSNADHGIHGETNSQAHAGVYAQNNGAFPCTALLSMSPNGHGVHGVNAAGSGKTPPHGAGLWGDTDGGIGVYGSSKTGNAGQFDGNVEIGGDVDVKGNQKVSGNVSVAGDVLLTGADCAEWFDLGALAAAAPGTLMVIGDDGALRPSERAYDRRVAGVVSGAGAFRPGIVLDQRASDAGRTTIALVGKVYCRVDAGAAPIQVGDLLTSSDTPGHAMKAISRAKSFGAVVGKALRPLASGRGLLPILVALQ